MSRGNQDNAPALFMQLHGKLLTLVSRSDVVDVLIVNGVKASAASIDAVTAIIRNNGLKKLDLSVSADAYDEDRKNICGINLLSEYAVKIVASTLRNITLTECSLYLTSSHRPIIKLLNLVLERNETISEASQPTVKEWVFNKYVNKINNLIEDLQKNPSINQSELLLPLQTQQTLHPLRYLVAFGIANKFYDANSEKLKKLPGEMQELVTASKTPTNL